MKKSSKYTAAEMEWLHHNRMLVLGEYHRQFIERFGRTDTTRDNLNQLRKRQGWKTGRTGHFQKGHTITKGEPMRRNPNSVATQFKKGNPSPTYRGPGAETIDRYGYIWIIVEQTNPRTGGATRQVLKHKWLWEQKNGPTPEGFVLKCLDGDKQNVAPENWKAVPKGVATRIIRRGYDGSPAELKPTIMAVAKLEHALRGRSS